MALKVKAQEKMRKIGVHAGTYRYIMMPELYTSLSRENSFLLLCFFISNSEGVKVGPTG